MRAATALTTALTTVGAVALLAVTWTTWQPTARAQPRRGSTPPQRVEEADPFSGAGAFRLDAKPKIEAVFGDAAAFRRTVDRFHTVHLEMQRARDDFAKNVQATLLTLQADRGGKRCPVDAVALTYTRAFRQGQLFQTLGTELESLQTQIKALDGLGETTGLTPDYRWKVTRALKLYARVLVDYREMKVAFQNQLAGDLRVHTCDAAALMTKGEEREKAGAPPTAEVSAPRLDPVLPVRRPGTEEPGPPVTASAATFFVDNSSCPSSVRVIVDGTLLGEVGSTSKAAFRALVGRHDLCVIPSTSKAQCGDSGTLRKTFIHDGWQIVMRCDRPQ